MIVIAAFVLGITACCLRSALACVLIAVVLAAAGALSGSIAGTDNSLEIAAAIGGYNMGVALALCGAIAVGLPNGR
ncbi:MULTISPECIES: hypothetical protein [unclassified Ensifer]|uniref:hypothetical protein n=1 Tax=unclassified Ensifer TaxID=2633371 RepID=UPI000813534E|nr:MULTISPECIES: hypothetical protein [unclassified Ensifer]OCP23360.1 hypothetical protein BC361_21790 [Ensifer sp. LC54]OCP26644.1 hypothetical protein BC363_14965 [Ensifer sp. LC384]OCP34614.1 hypothetical protein BC360_11025 [Ensifer sp. LC163]